MAAQGSPLARCPVPGGAGPPRRARRGRLRPGARSQGGEGRTARRPRSGLGARRGSRRRRTAARRAVRPPRRPPGCSGGAAPSRWSGRRRADPRRPGRRGGPARRRGRGCPDDPGGGRRSGDRVVERRELARDRHPARHDPVRSRQSRPAARRWPGPARRACRPGRRGVPGGRPRGRPAGRGRGGEGADADIAPDPRTAERSPRAARPVAGAGPSPARRAPGVGRCGDPGHRGARPLGALGAAGPRVGAGAVAHPAQRPAPLHRRPSPAGDGVGGVTAGGPHAAGPPVDGGVAPRPGKGLSRRPQRIGRDPGDGDHDPDGLRRRRCGDHRPRGSSPPAAAGRGDPTGPGRPGDGGDGRRGGRHRRAAGAVAGVVRSRRSGHGSLRVERLEGAAGRPADPAGVRPAQR